MWHKEKRSRYKARYNKEGRAKYKRDKTYVMGH